MPMDLLAFELRRKAFAEEIGDALAIIPGGREAVRNHDVTYPFRQASDFFFLTGFPEPDAVAVLNPAHPTERYVLFVRPKDREREIWDGYRAGTTGAMDDYGADAAYPIADLETKLREYAVERSAIYYQLGNPYFDPKIVSLLENTGDQRNRSGWTVPSAVESPARILHEMRLFKTAPEVESLTRACDISVEAHKEAMRYVRPDMYEYQAQAVIEFVFRSLGSPRDGYPSIVGSGPNSCILHYVENNRQMRDGDLLLIDAGAEYGQFSADITRTFPVNGKFTAPQRAIYEIVLAAEAEGVGMSGPGGTLDSLRDATRRIVTQGLVDLGLVPGPFEDAYAMGMGREFFMHGTSHWLGLDVHDAGRYRVERESRPLQPGMAFTVEPGVYVDPKRPKVSFALTEFDEEADRDLVYEIGAEAARKQIEERREAAKKIEHAIPEEFLGIGIRIEDDVLVTEDGYVNLTEGVPREPDEIEALCAEASVMPVL